VTTDVKYYDESGSRDSGAKRGHVISRKSLDRINYLTTHAKLLVFSIYITV
jgi:hypothetical protein